jgi:hypothetical protein
VALTGACGAETTALVPHVDGTHYCSRGEHTPGTLHECVCGARWLGAPRQAGTEQQVQEAEQVRHDLERLGVATGVRALTPASAGHAVRLIVGDGSSVGVLHLEPQQAADLAQQLLDDAQDAIYADRAVRRG